MTRQFRDPSALQGSTPTIQQLLDSLVDVFSFVRRIEKTTGANYTTTAKGAHEEVEATTTLTVSLSREHSNGDLVTVYLSGTGTVTVDTEGSESIAGASSYSLTTQYQSVTLRKRDNWFIEGKS